MVVRRTWALPTLVALVGTLAGTLTGCGGRTPARRPSGPPLVIPSPSPSHTGKPRPARAGTVCGQITTVTGAHARVIVVRGVTTCAEAMRIFTEYHDPATPAEGSAGLAVVDHWTCQTRHTVTTCVRKTTTIESRH